MNPIGVCFRFDASPSVGRGHVQRCAALAAAFSARGAAIRQVVCRGEISMLDAETAAAFPDIVYMNDNDLTAANDAYQIVKAYREQQADLLVLDSYCVDEEYQQILLRNDIRWLQFDSFGQQRFYGGWVLNASPGADECLYAKLRCRESTRFLLGPAYAILNARFAQLHGRARQRATVSRVAICTGGGNDGGATLRILESLRDVIDRVTGWDVIVGGSNQSLENIRCLLAEPPYSSNVSLHIDTADVPVLFEAADLAILTAGTVSYEAAALGLPMILMTIADNQEMNAQGWCRSGAAITCGSVNADFQPERLRDMFSDLIADPVRVEAMSCAAGGQIDGQGAMRVADTILARKE